MDQEKEYLTQKKFDELSKELDYLRRVRRKEIADQLEYAKSLGDLSENAEYHEARDEQAKIEERIAQLENVLKFAEIVAPHHSDVVEVGSTVTVTKVADGMEATYMIVGPEESDVSEGKISHRSPLGATVLGKKTGEEFTFETPKGKMKYKIINIK